MALASKVLNQTKLIHEAQQHQAKLIHEAIMQAQQQAQKQAPQNQKQIVDMFSQMSTMLDLQAKKIEDTLNKLGSEGWELAGITEALYILKRPVK